MKTLVVVASRHGSTQQIGDCIREELESTGIKAHLFDPADVADLAGYDAVVLGSAVYAGRWLGSARKFAKQFETDLLEKPVWLFSSGPIGDPAKPTQPPVDGVELAQRLRARDHQVFEGRLQHDLLGLTERAVVRIVGAEHGDFRQWLAIGAWARRIGKSLQSGAANVAASA